MDLLQYEQDSVSMGWKIQDHNDLVIISNIGSSIIMKVQLLV